MKQGNRKRRVRYPAKWYKVLFADILVFAAVLLVFALFHHVLPSRLESTGKKSSRYASSKEETSESSSSEAAQQDDTAEAAESLETTAGDTVESVEDEETAEANTSSDAFKVVRAQVDDIGLIVKETVAPVLTPLPQPTATAAAVQTAAAQSEEDPVGSFAHKFADKFTDGDVEETEDSYKSGNVNIKLTKYDENDVQYYVADIYVKDIENLVSAFADDSYGKGITEKQSAIAERINAILAVNGDYYGAHSTGIVIRNGELYRTSTDPDLDTCVLYWDGTMETISAKKGDADELIENGAYQAWSFGPSLLDENGKSMDHFNSSLTPHNPRTIIGYYEPGHYCFVLVDGRSDDSDGMTLAEASQLMEDLGCKVAYNLDGGQTSVMTRDGGTVVNNPYKGGRKCSDIIAIVDN